MTQYKTPQRGVLYCKILCLEPIYIKRKNTSYRVAAF